MGTLDWVPCDVKKPFSAVSESRPPVVSCGAPSGEKRRKQRFLTKISQSCPDEE
jgi:hypothetical protein